MFTLRRLVQRTFNMRPGEGLPAVIAAVFFFLVLTASMVARPAREAPGMDLAGVALFAVPLAVAWAALGVWLGYAQRAKAKASVSLQPGEHPW